MDVARPYTALSPALDGAVLNALAGTTRPLTGREVSRLAGRKSHAGVLAVLGRLVEHGLVDRREAGSALLYTLNREHLAAPAVLLVAGIREELFRRLREAVGAWSVAPVHTSLFGSAARGDGDTSSDIDLLVIRPTYVAIDDTDWRRQLDDLAAAVLTWTGNRLSVSEISEGDIPRLRAEEAPILRDLDEDSILLAGTALPAVARFAP